MERGVHPYGMIRNMMEMRRRRDQRVLEGQTRLFFTEEGDVRPGKVRKAAPPGILTVAHLEVGNFQGSSVDYWNRGVEALVPGATYLELLSVCWLDVESVFHGLPPGGYVFSWHLIFPTKALPCLSFLSASERHLEFTISTIMSDGTAGRSVSFGAPFSRPAALPN